METENLMVDVENGNNSLPEENLKSIDINEMSVQSIDFNETNEEADSKDIPNGNHHLGEFLNIYLFIYLAQEHGELTGVVQ